MDITDNNILRKYRLHCISNCVLHLCVIIWVSYYYEKEYEFWHKMQQLGGEAF